MKRMMLGILLLLLLTLPTAAQPTELYDGTVSLRLPEGFRPMTPAEIDQKYPRSQPPQFAFTNSDQLSQTIAVSRLRFPPGKPPALGELGAQMQQRVAIQAGVTVHRHGLVEIGTRQWYAIEFTSGASEQPVENMLRITLTDSHIIILAANVIGMLPTQESAVRSAVDSVILR